MSCLSWLLHYDILQLVPFSNSIEYAKLATLSGVPEKRLKTIVRLVMTNGLLREYPNHGSIRHTATSALLARDPNVYAWARHLCDRSAPMAMSMVAAHRRFGAATTRKNETAYNVAFDTDLPFFEHIAQDDESTREFAAYMRNVTSGHGVSLNHLLAGYRWDNVRSGGVVVDVSTCRMICAL